MPNIDDHFLTVTSLVRTYKSRFVRNGDTFVLYYHDPGPGIPNHHPSAKLQVSCCLFGLERAFPVATQADKSRGLSEFANCEGG
jgi:hypothetical protein